MASLQARHSRECPKYPWTPFAKSTKKDGCTCTPLYYVVIRNGKKLAREPVGHNRKEAERALDARRGDVARRKYRVIENVHFDEWADTWIASLRTAGRKESTVLNYEVTLNYAKDAFGKGMNVRDIQPSDISAMLEGIAKKPRTVKKVTQSTLAKHLRQLGSCLGAAVSEGYAEDNPVSRLHSTRRPKVSQSAPAYFTNDELSRLWPELDDLPLYSYLCRIALATGMRSGELVALRWSDVSMTTNEVIVSRTYDAGVGETATKSGKSRTVDLSPQAVQLFTDWYALSGEGLVFETETGGHLSSNHVIRQVLYPAMQRAGVPRKGEHGRDRTFHSFRHTFARITLEAGAEITWVQQQLGHQSIQLTVSTYGRWSRAAQKKQAERLAGAFPL